MIAFLVGITIILLIATVITIASIFGNKERENLDKATKLAAKASIENSSKVNVINTSLNDENKENEETKNIDYYKANKLDKEHENAYGKLNLPASREDYEQINYKELFNETDDHFLYVSDLHIIHKIELDYPEDCFPLKQKELYEYINKIAKKFVKSINLDDKNYSYNIIFDGDITSDLNIFEMFFECYSKNLNELYEFGSKRIRTFVILGNHEFWDAYISGCKDVNEVKKEYKNILDEFGIVLLQNDVYFPYKEGRIISLNNVTNSKIEKINKYFLECPYAIFGGVGFSGKNSNFNVDYGLYDTFKLTREDEIKESQIVEDIHNLLAKITPNKRKVVFVTHMQISDWGNIKIQPNFYYVVGHNHINKLSLEESVNIFGDNQLGYKSKSYQFKYFVLNCDINVFESFIDGVHEITKDEYARFNQYFHKIVSFNAKVEKVLLVKRNNCYMFFAIQNKKLYYLRGGTLKSTKHQDPNYFYDNIVDYCNSVKNFMNDYLIAQNKISTEIKKIKGDGKVHGCIIDIDFFNHIFFNPFDLSLTPYTAISKTKKDIYKNIPSLLKYEVPSIYKNYDKLIERKTNELSIIGSNSMTISNKTTYDKTTEIYNISQKIMDFQTICRSNIVKIWDDSIMNLKPKKVEVNDEIKLLK